MKTYSALFAGFDLAGKGLEAAGLEPINLFEFDPKLAEIGQANSTGKYVVADVCDIDWHRYERPDVLWASPVCKNASQANCGAVESPIDMVTAEATCRAIEVWLPDVVFIENVWLYRHFKSFALLRESLIKNDYWFDVEHLNSADFGVPQTRKRLIMRAHRDGFLPPLPHKTKWRGWYQAIEDLIPTLPETEFAPWQLTRLPDLAASSLVDQTNVSRDCTVRTITEPCHTITTNFGRRPSHMPWAFISAATGTHVTTRHIHEPAPTVVSSDKTIPHRAFIADGKPNDMGKSLTTRHDSEPVFTVVAQHGTRKVARAWLEQGRVVSMTPRALGRFQTLPDSFVLSGNTKLDCTGIGNGVPCALAEALVRPFL